jgi:hypothetical protein
MAAALGQPVVIQNVAGSAGVIGVERLVRAPPDGYTLALSGDAAVVVVVVVRVSMEPRPPYPSVGQPPPAKASTALAFHQVVLYYLLTQPAC